MSRYEIKCDDCKTTIGTTDSVRASAAGGHCDSCRVSIVRARIAAGETLNGYSLHVAEAVAYYDLCDRAAKLGIPVAADDPDAPETVADLVAAVRQAEAA